jgi:hypothetical protein
MAWTRLLLVLVLVGVAGVFAGGAHADSPERATLDWAGRSFSSGDQLEQWLTLRGRSYEVWAVRHPDAARRLRPRTMVLPPAEQSAQPAVTPVVAGAAVGAGAAILLLVLAALPISALVRVHPLRHLPHRRFELATSGLVLLLAAAMVAALSSGPAL